MPRVYLTAIVRALPGQEAVVEAALVEMAKFAEDEEPGVLVYSLNRQADDPSRFVLFEVFADEAARQAHQSTAAMRVLQTKLQGARDGATEMLPLQPIWCKGLP